MKVTTKYVLDARYKKTTDTTYPIRLRLTYKQGGKFIQKYLPTDHSLSKKGFKVMIGEKPGDLQEIRDALDELKIKANAIIKKMRPFSFELFKKKFAGNSNEAGLLSVAFDKYEKSLRENDQVGTASSYVSAKKSIEAFQAGLTFDEATPEKLKQYEKWMKAKGNSTTTLGMYLRCLRSLFNEAIEDGEIPADIYPFSRTARRTGKTNGKYVIRKGSRRKFALTLDEWLFLLNEYKPPADTITEMMKDYFVFMTCAQGINPIDFCLLKYKNINDDILIYVREKTKRTTTEVKEIVMVLSERMKAIIDKWGNPKEPENYIFQILKPRLSAAQIHVAKNYFVSVMNDQLKFIAKGLGIQKNITTYVARHTWASLSEEAGLSIYEISQGLGHGNITTSQGYLAEINKKRLIIRSDAFESLNNKIEKTKVVNM